MRLFQWKAVFLVPVLLGLGGFAQADPSTGEITRVDLNAHKIYFENHVVVEVGARSRLFDQDGHRLELSELATSVDRYRDQKIKAIGDVPYATYETVDAQGRIIVEELHLSETPR